MWAFLLQPYAQGLEESCGVDAVHTLDLDYSKTTPSPLRY